MKVLIDENIDEDFPELLPEHELLHVRALGWQGRTNGQLLKLAGDNAFEAFVTADKNMSYQQSMVGRSFFLIILDIHPVHYANLAACVPALQGLLKEAKPGEVHTIDGPSARRHRQR